jgi:hypothetical protein
MPQNGSPDQKPNGGGDQAPNGGRANRLSSWKEIADYLGCDERTCLRWEKAFGLPIHRLEGAKKSRVYAFRDEIDRWQREKSSLFNGKSGTAGGAGDAGEPGSRLRADGVGSGIAARAGSKGGRGDGSGPGRERGHERGRERGRDRSLRRRSVAVWSASAVIVLAAVLLTALSLSVPRVPADFRIEGSTLVILNAKGKALWRHESGPKNLAWERYRSSKPRERWYWEDKDLVLPHLIIDDLDGDGRVETLFNAQTDDGRSQGNILCFSHRGKKLWEFETGIPLEIGTTRFSGDFAVRGFDVVDLDGDGRKEILLIAHQLHRFPTRLTVLDANGELRGDYWNSGQLADFLVIDLDGDGRSELLAYGTNNEYGQGVLIVFDAADVRGCSPQADESFRWKDMEPGSQLHYIRIPRPDAELAAGYFPVDDIPRVFSLKDGRLAVWSGRSGLEYVFDGSLNILEVRGSHSFQVLHENARRAGKISSVADAAYFEDLRRRILYWDGSDWTTESALAVAKGRQKRK